MRLGFVGCGRWAQKLAASFRECGAEIVAHDRRSKCSSCGGDGGCHPSPSQVTPPPGRKFGPCSACHGGADRTRAPGFGRYLSWRDQLADKSIDAIIAVAPPEVTTEVALACAAAGKPVMATKPLFDHPATIRAPFYVDFWRLWAQAREHALMFQANFPGHPFVIELHGSGPHRSFPGMFDWGPHVIAQLLDTFRNGDNTYESVKREYRDGGELFTVMGTRGDRAFRLVFGNGSNKPKREMKAGNLYVGIEEGTLIGTEEKSVVLLRFCQSFLNDVSEGFVDTRLLELSRRGMEELRKIREMAK